MNFEESAKIFTGILGLTNHPIAVTFFEEAVPLEGFELPSDRRYCQVLMGAG